MLRVILMLFIVSSGMNAGFMDSVGDVVKSTLSDDEDENKIKTVGTVGTKIKHNDNDKKESFLDEMIDDVKDTISGDKKGSSKDDSILDKMVSSAKKTIGLKETEKKKKSSFFKDSVTAIKEVAGLKKVKQDNSIFDGGMMGEVADIIDLEKGESWGLPSVFGINKRKQKKVFGSTILADTLLGDAKDASTGFYRGFKNTGESTEFMSGVMYKSSKVYNGMFGMFDDSLFNIFDDKDDREPSIFDAVDQGNSILDMFD